MSLILWALDVSFPIEVFTRHWFDISSFLEVLDNRGGFGEDGSLSLAQLGEAVQKRRVLGKMDDDEQMHIEWNSGPGKKLVIATPLTWKKWEF